MHGARGFGQVQPLDQPSPAGLVHEARPKDLPEAGGPRDLAQVAHEKVGSRTRARDDDEGARLALRRQEAHGGAGKGRGGGPLS